jgi:hypothetical protein
MTDMNLNTILQTIQARDSRDLTQDDINKMLLEIIDKALSDDNGAKGLEVALKAVAKLSEGIEDVSLNQTDEDIKERLPMEVLKLVEGRR